jgi:hypothetical protein
MTKMMATLTMLLAAEGLAACANSDRYGTGSGYYSYSDTSGYVGRFDNDENRRPMFVDETSRNRRPQALIYGDGEH